MSSSEASSAAEDVLDNAVAGVRRKFAMKPKVAIAGFGKSGKSSLFNAIYGEKIASVSMRTDETIEAHTQERFGIDFTDTPGIGTGKFSLEKVLELGVLDRQHVVIHVLNGASAISSEDERLHDAILRSNARRVTVVNKVDLLDAQEQREFSNSVEEKLGLVPGAFLFVAAKHGLHVPELVQHIADILPDAMQDAFIGQQQADLTLKEKRIRTLVYSKAALCGALALVPVPVADIFMMTPVQVAMVTAIGYFHGIEVNKERALELMATVGAGVGFREAARQLLKLVPGFGPAISAAVAFAGTVALGETANVWFKNRMKVDPDVLRTLFRRTAEDAKEQYARHQERTQQFREKLQALKAERDSGEITDEAYELRLAALGDDLEP